jgi:hypothetical protein
MLELGSSGSVRGVSSNGHPYRDPRSTPALAGGYQMLVRSHLCATEYVCPNGPRRRAPASILSRPVPGYTDADREAVRRAISTILVIH